MIALVACTLLLSILLLALHLPLRARAEDLRRAARAAPDLGLRPRFAEAASKASFALLVLALAPLPTAALRLVSADTAIGGLGILAALLIPLAPLLMAISGLATPFRQRTKAESISYLLLWVAAFGMGICPADILL